jgi:YHS domain-containing protein
MDDLKNLEQQIRVKLAFATERRQSEQETDARMMQDRERRREGYQRSARHLMASGIRPRIEKVMAFFPNALLSPAEAATESQWSCRFRKTPDFPASTKLSFLVSPDTEIENVIVTYDLEILPIFFQFQGHDQIVVPIAGIGGGPIEAWVDARLLGFVDTYLQLRTLDQYQLSGQVADPVCGKRINRADAAAQIAHEGRTYYFCRNECRRQFESDPLRYVKAAPAQSMRTAVLHGDDHALGTVDDNHTENVRHQYSMTRPEYE